MRQQWSYVFLALTHQTVHATWCSAEISWGGNAFHDDVIKWKHFSALLAICAGNSPVPGEFLAQRPVTRSFDVFFDLRLIKRLSKLAKWKRME